MLKSRGPVPCGSSTRHRRYLDVKGCHWFDTVWDFQKAYGLSVLGFLIAFKNPPGSLIITRHVNISRKKSVPWSLAKLLICLSWPFLSNEPGSAVGRGMFVFGYHLWCSKTRKRWLGWMQLCIHCSAVFTGYQLKLCLVSQTTYFCVIDANIQNMLMFRCVFPHDV